MSQRTPYGQGIRRRQFRESAGDDYIGGHSSSSDVRFDSLIPHTPHSYADGPSSTPAEVGGSSTPPAPRQNCIMIRPLGSSFDNIWCKRDITRIIRSKFEKPYTSWKKTDPAVRDMWFGKFKGLDKNPSWMCLVVFEALKEYWNTPEFMSKLEKAKKNRSSDIGGSKHTCGSIPMSEHKKRLSKLLGRPPTQAELFIAMHQRKDSSGFVDSRSEETYADFQMWQASSQSSAVGPTEYSDAAGQPSQAAFDETSLWLEVAGGKKKGCVYGMGSEAHVIPSSYHVLSPLPPPPQSSISLADQIQQAVSCAINAAIEPFNHRLSAIEERFHNPSSSSPPSNPSDH
ncbi:uncharacterized protein LOC127802215 [Diospyros lotus]|uniref:uncharacterized protein LOC127802215 n=1 Tax=Diospyros lotus TaxID=55363 RepID=UPI0022586A86|nr:uncharacterized protein LOC127802215 [Diospyros lotus]